MINELIEQIGRERLEAIVYAMGAEPWDADPILDSVTHGDIGKMARALLAVLDAQEEPAAWISERNLAALGRQFSVRVKHEPVMVRPVPLYTTPPAAYVPDGWRIVPVEPTIAMTESAWDKLNESHNMHNVYYALLENAPAAPAPGGVDG